jgi:hypothetical protein
MRLIKFELFLLVIFCSFVGTSNFVFAQEETGGEGTQNNISSKANKAKDEIDCRKVRTTSSRIKRKICLKESQWKRIEESSQLLSREMYSS